MVGGQFLFRGAKMYELIQGDCIEVMKGLEAGSIDAIITDLPYGTTQCSWDEVIPLTLMWEQVKRILKPSGVFITTASQPFTSQLVASNLEWFRYEWIWEKEQGTNFLDARRKPYKVHENICVFAPSLPAYFPIYTHGAAYVNGKHRGSEVYSGFNDKQELKTHGRFPRSVQKFNRETGLHPTQKPVSLYSYLIRTYTSEGDTVADFCMGSGTTGIAAIKAGRNFIGCDNEPTYFAIAQKRIEDAAAQPLLLGAL
jgi:site-specific DNA-methyltransferase (adenine-specific)